MWPAIIHLQIVVFSKTLDELVITNYNHLRVRP